MKKELEFTITSLSEPTTVNQILRTKLGLTKKQISQAKFRSNGISKNGVSCRVTETVSIGDSINICLEDKTADSPQILASKGTLPLEILYEDEDILAVNKPANLVTHPIGGHYQDTLVNQVAAYFQEKKEPMRLRPVGRLDKETSGIVLFAKNQTAAARLQIQREKNQFEKQYLALVSGTLPIDDKDFWNTISFPVFQDPTSRLKMKALKKGDSAPPENTPFKTAITHYQTLYHTSSWSLVTLKLETGRTHQIRVHMQALGHPLLGDSLYGIYGTNEELQIKRAALHAWKVTFLQPFSNQLITLEAPLPEDFTNVLAPVLPSTMHSIFL